MDTMEYAESHAGDVGGALNEGAIVEATAPQPLLIAGAFDLMRAAIEQAEIDEQVARDEYLKGLEP